MGKSQATRPRPAGRGPFGIQQPAERKSPLILASGLALAVAIGLTGTLAWLGMKQPGQAETEMVAVKADNPPAAPRQDGAGQAVSTTQANEAPAPTRNAVAPSPQQPAAAAPSNMAAATPPSQPALGFAAEPVQHASEVTAAIAAPSTEALRDVVVSADDRKAGGSEAPAAAPQPSPAPRSESREVAALEKPKSASAPVETSSGDQALIRRAVNMRAAAQPGSRVITVIPANTPVVADLPCKHWCAVTYKGQRGYVYRDYLTAR